MTNPPVAVVEIKPENTQELYDLGFDLAAFLDSKGPKVTLGSTQERDAKLNDVLQSYAAKSTSLFFLKWRGRKVPRGALIRGHEVDWTQNGRVSDTKGETIGTYSRLVEFGPNDEQQMIVYYIGRGLY